MQPAEAQFPGVVFETLASGHTDVAKIEKIRRGPTDMLVQKVTVAPGAGPPWHCHPGTTLFIVTEGTWAHEHPDGTVETLGGGTQFSAVVEPAGAVRKGTNVGTTTVHAHIVFLPPAGAPPTVPVSGPEAPCPYPP